MSKINAVPYEPKQSFRWIIEVQGSEIPPYCFTHYTLFNAGNITYCNLKLVEPVHVILTPDSFLNIHTVTIKHLDPFGNVVNGFEFGVRNTKFISSADYASDSILTHQLSMEIRPNSITPKYY